MSCVAVGMWIHPFAGKNHQWKNIPLYFFPDKGTVDVTGENITKGLKMTATLLNYPSTRGIPIAHINTHSLQRGSAYALVLSEYSDMQIKNG
jgi:hypothetical protein